MRRRPHTPTLLQRATSPATAFALVCTLCVGALCLHTERAHTQSARAVARVTNGFKHDPQAAPSAVIFPARASALSFDHAKHSAQTCASCHGVGTRAPMQTCASCHGASSDAKTSGKKVAAPALSDCKGCHQGYNVRAKGAVSAPAQWRAVRPAPMIPKVASARLKFDHATHAKRAGKQAGADAWCASCHGKASAVRMPTSDGCTQCHNGTLAQDTCQTCHLGGANGQMQTDFSPVASPNAKPVSLKPTNHTVNWIKRHGPVAQTMSDTCMSCHGQDTCTSCHQQKAAIPRSVHPPNFLVVHRAAARAANPNCTSCHQQQTFCVSCHVRTRVATSPAAARPPSTRKFHPPGWLLSTRANNHGVMAKRNINECASCHQERDCLSCHTGISPHPPGFSSTCKTMLAANPLPCLKCHTNNQTLKAQCR